MARKKPSYAFGELPASRSGVERQTGRVLSIRTSIPLKKLGIHVNKQKESPFCILPAELRNKIYELVFAEFEYTDCALLLTCRLIWIEAYDYPISSATPTFWFWNGPRDLTRMELNHAAPEDKAPERATICTSETQYLQQYFKKLTPINRTNIINVQIFASQAWLDSLNLESYFSKQWFAAKILKITIRKFDWSGSPISCDRFWLTEMLSSPLLANIQELNFVLEWTHEQQLHTIATAFASITSKNFTCHGYTMNINSETYIVTATITWKSHASVPDIQKHPRGYTVRDGHVETFVGVPIRAKPQKRGGRRSQSVWYRNHWQPGFSGPDGKKALRDGKAAALTEKWIGEGSLLCLV